MKPLWLMLLLILPTVSALSVDTFDGMSYKEGEIIHFTSISYNTTGLVDADCLLQIYDQYQNLTVNQTYANSYDVVNLSSGTYRYYTTCNASNEFATATGTLTVSHDGFPKSSQPSVFLAVLILVPMLCGIVILYGAMSMDSEEHIAFKIFAYLVAATTTYFSFGLGLTAVTRFYDFPMFQENLTFTWWVIGTLVGLMMTYFILYLIKKAFSIAAQDRAERFEY